MAVSTGCSNTARNLQLLCASCNRKKRRTCDQGRPRPSHRAFSGFGTGHGHASRRASVSRRRSRHSTSATSGTPRVSHHRRSASPGSPAPSPRQRLIRPQHRHPRRGRALSPVRLLMRRRPACLFPQPTSVRRVLKRGFIRGNAIRPPGAEFLKVMLTHEADTPSHRIFGGKFVGAGVKNDECSQRARVLRGVKVGSGAAGEARPGSAPTASGTDHGGIPKPLVDRTARFLTVGSGSTAVEWALSGRSGRQSRPEPLVYPRWAGLAATPASLGSPRLSGAMYACV